MYILVTSVITTSVLLFVGVVCCLQHPNIDAC